MSVPVGKMVKYGSFELAVAVGKCLQGRDPVWGSWDNMTDMLSCYIELLYV